MEVKGRSGARSGTALGLLAALGALYVAQGIPFGFATEYLPVVLRESGASHLAIASIGWLQLPWQAKILWAHAADSPPLRRRTRAIIFGLQLLLTVTVAAFALGTMKEAPLLWFVLTFLAALLAATQDVFVDAFAVRVLRPEDRGFGNTAQVAGYRLGMLVGGGALLLLVGRLGERWTLVGCAGVVLLASVGAFLGSEEHAPPEPATAERRSWLASFREIFGHVTATRVRAVALLAITFKLGLHLAGPLLKPMAVDYGWSKRDIGGAIVAAGLVCSLAGSAIGGALHRALGERRALFAALIAQGAACLPLVVVDRLHAPFLATTIAIGLEHLVSGLGTTILFAALMSATRPDRAGLHYTLLTSLNALAIGLGAMLGGALADLLGRSPTFVVAALVCLAPAVLLRGWDEAAAASRGPAQDATTRG